MSNAYAPAVDDPFAKQDAPDDNPFLKFRMPDEAEAKGPAEPPPDDNPFLKFRTTKDTEPKEPEVSATGSFLHSMVRSAIPALGSLPAMGVGAEIGAAIGTFGGPAAPVTVPVGTVVGALAAGFGAGHVLHEAQSWALSKLPDSWREAIGQDDRQQRLEQAAHPQASFLGGLAPFALAMRPSGFTGAKLPENATALQRIMANPATAKVFGGAVMGGMELGTEALQGHVDWTNVGIATAFGMVFSKPTRIGETLTEAGARPTRRVLGREPAAKAAPAAPEPTVAEAGDLKVMGPGVTEAVFQGGHEMAPEAALTAQQAARTERSIIGEPPAPDVHDVARRMHVDLFDRYEELQAQRNDLAMHAPDGDATAAGHILKIDQELAEVQPQVAAAYRRAAEAAGSPLVEPEAPHVSDPAQRAAIADDVTRKLIAAGRPPEEAAAAGQLIASRYEARAAWFKGALGTAQELYAREGAEIRGKGISAAPAIAEPPPKPTGQGDRATERELAQADEAPTPEAAPESPAAQHSLLARAKDAATRAMLAADKIGLTDPDTTWLPPYFLGKIFYQQGEKAPPFYSAVERAVTNAKQEKASPEQWLGTLKNAAGIKAEEMEWLGLADWLKEQKGPVTKQAVQDYVRANAIEVKEVVRGDANRPTELPDGYTVVRTNDLGGRFEVHDREGKLVASRPDRGRAIEAALGQLQEDKQTKFSDYQLPGGENYRELLLTLPEQRASDVTQRMSEIERRQKELVREYNSIKRDDPEFESKRDAIDAETERLDKEYQQVREEPFYGGHWSEPNVLAHVRFNDRTTDGKKTLFVEEVQSDWHQQGRKRGYESDATRAAAKERQDRLRDLTEQDKAIQAEYDRAYRAREHQLLPELMQRQNAVRRQFDQIVRVDTESTAVPDAPFKTTWPELALKRIIRYAAENGYDQIAWTRGEAQATNPKNLGRTGEEAEKSDAALKRFYNEELVNGANKLGKKFGAKVGSSEFKHLDTTNRDVPFTVRDRDGVVIETDITDENYAAQRARDIGGTYGFDETAGETRTTPIHTLDLTPQLRDAAIEQGFPLFQRGRIKRGEINLNPRGVPGRDYLGIEGEHPHMTLTRDANASSMIHESGHDFLAQLMRDAVHRLAPEQLKSDAATVLKWFGVDSAEAIKTKHHEKFARGFEQYLREGIAPSPELAGVFARFKQWLINIYQTLKGLGQPINDDIRRVFDRMLAAEPQRTVVAAERTGGPTLADIHEADARLTEVHEASPAADRIAAEHERFVQEPPPEIVNELAPVVAKVEAAAAARAGIEPGAEAGEGARQPGEVGGGSGEPGTVAKGGGVGGPSGEVGGGRGEPAGEGAAGVGTPGRGAAAADAGGHPLAATPATLFGKESPFLDRAGNIRVENLTSNEDVARAIHDAADANNDFIGDRRGVVTDGQVMELADALGMDFEQVTKRKIGQAFNAEQVMAARKLLVKSAEGVSAAMKKAAVGTDEDVMAYAMAKDRHQMIQAQVAGITAEAGRALRAFRSIAGQEAVQGVDQFIRQATGKTLFQLREEAQLGATLETPQAVSKFMQDAQKRTFGRMILEYWINGLLSGPATHSTNVIGNAILTLQHALPETATAAAIGSIRRALGREGEVIRIGEIGARLKGLARAVPSGLKGAAQSFRAGTSMALPGEEVGNLPLFQHYNELAARPVMDEAATYSSIMADAFGAAQGLQDGIVAAGALLKAGGVEGSPLIGTRYSLTGAIPDITVRGMNVLPVGTAVRVPGRFLAAADSFFRAINYSMAKNARAYRVASDEGHVGNAFDARVAQFRDSPDKTWMSDFVDEAVHLTLMERGGSALQAISRLSNVEMGGVPVFKFVMPFVNVAGNIMKQAVLERTPLGLFSAEIHADLAGKNGNVAQDMATARMLIGTGLAVTFGTLAAQGLASGSGPTDQNEAAMWRLAGNQAHSVRIGDIWYDVQKLGPLGMLLGISADLYDVAHSAQEGEMTEAASHLIHAFSQNILDQSMMKGPAELLRAINDSDRYGEQYVRNFLSAFVPFSVGSAQMAKLQDPYSRQTRTVVDAIRAKIPGHLNSWFDNELFPKRDIWGEPMLAPETLGGPGVTGIKQKQISSDPVNIAMLDLNINPGPVARKIRNVDLTDQQFDDFARIAGRTTKMRLDTIVRSEIFRSQPTHVRHDLIKATIDQSREAARGMVMMKYPQIVRDAVEAKRERLRD